MRRLLVGVKNVFAQRTCCRAWPASQSLLFRLGICGGMKCQHIRDNPEWAKDC